MRKDFKSIICLDSVEKLVKMFSFSNKTLVISIFAIIIVLSVLFSIGIYTKNISEQRNLVSTQAITDDTDVTTTEADVSKNSGAKSGSVPEEGIQFSAVEGDTIEFELTFGDQQISYNLRVVDIPGNESASLLIVYGARIFHLKKGEPISVDINKDTFDDTIIELAGVENAKAIFIFKQISETQGVCGNFICEFGETTENCPYDCKTEKKQELDLTFLRNIGQWSVLGIIGALFVYIVLARKKIEKTRKKYFLGLKIKNIKKYKKNN